MVDQREHHEPRDPGHNACAQRCRSALTLTLPDLQDNIKCGNSLVDPDYFQGFSDGLGADAKAAVNAFDWAAEFPDVFARGGFDAIVMNPPWLMAGYYVKPALPYFQSRFAIATGNYDMYYLFIERALQICTPGGRLGMIVPNKLFHTRAARALREVIRTSRRLEEIVDFGDAQLFARATNYSCILLLGPPPSATAAVKYTRSDRTLISRESFLIGSDDLAQPVWTFAAASHNAVFDQMRRVSRPLSELTTHFGNGVQTGADSIYLIDAATAGQRKLESDGLAPFLRGRDVRRYAATRGRTSVVFPYRSGSTRFELLGESELAKWPNITSYLMAHRGRLDARRWFGKTATELSGAWYGLMYLDRPQAFDSVHLLTPSLTKRGSFALDRGAMFATGTAGVTSVVPRDDIPESPEYLLAVLNSTLLTHYAVAHSPVFRGGHYKYSKNYIAGLPIRRIDPLNPADKAIHDQLSALAIERLAAGQDVAAASTTHDKVMRMRRAGEAEAAIDDLVFALYGITAQQAEAIKVSERARLAPVAKVSVSLRRRFASWDRGPESESQ